MYPINRLAKCIGWVKDTTMATGMLLLLGTSSHSEEEKHRKGT